MTDTPELEPTPGELLQEEPPLTAIPVAVDGPVRVTELPARNGGSGTVVVDATGATAAPSHHVLRDNPKRKRAWLVAAAPFQFGSSQALAVSGSAATWPANVPLEIDHYGDVWVAAPAGQAVTVTFVISVWAR